VPLVVRFAGPLPDVARPGRGSGRRLRCSLLGMGRPGAGRGFHAAPRLTSPDLRPKAGMIIALLGYSDWSAPKGRPLFDLADVT
jgi:hypothetical protein